MASGASAACVPVAEAAVAEPSIRVNVVAIASGLAIATGLFYAPVLDAQFLNWDDPPYVTANPYIRTLDWGTVVWAFTTFHEGIWHPLTWLSLALDHALYGLQPRGFHLTNLLLHVANTVLVFLVWERMTGALGRSAVVAALFGLHPMHVESVAWVTERKDVLSTFFWLLTMGAYVRYVRVRTPAAYGLILLAFVLGLLAKPMLITLPFALLLLDYWPLQRLSRSAVVEKVPLLALALLVTGIAVTAVWGVRSDAVPDPIPIPALLANAVLSTTKYLWLTVWPFRLSPWYSHPWFEGPPLSALSVGSAAVVVGSLSVLAIAVARRRPYVPVGWFWYVGTLVPVLGLVYNGRQGMADRYAYVPHIGLFVAATWAVADLSIWRDRTARQIGGVALAAALVVLSVLTARQTCVWRDDRTFWGYTARVNPHSFIAHQAMAGLMQHEGKTREALALFRRAAKIRPEVGRVHMQYGRLLSRAGRPGPAASRYRKAVALEPDVAEHRYGLAQVLVTQKHRASARRQLEQALALRPDYPEARQSLATLDAGSGATP